MSPRLEKSLVSTLAMRAACAPIFLPLFDHCIVLAKDSAKHGYSQRAGRELAHARKVAGHAVCRRCGQPIIRGTDRCSAGCLPRACVTVGYETLTDESVENGDVEDLGLVHPETEKRHSYRKGGERVRQANIRRSRAGELDWSLRAALDWIENNSPGYFEAYVDSGRVLTSADSADGKVRLVWTLALRAVADGNDIVCGARGYEYADARENLELHFRSESHGSVQRLRRVLEARFGVRFDSMG